VRIRSLGGARVASALEIADCPSCSPLKRRGEFFRIDAGLRDDETLFLRKPRPAQAIVCEDGVGLPLREDLTALFVSFDAALRALT
jgi:hypothetical protein